MTVIMVMGYPASGKGTAAKEYIDQGYLHLNRDKSGGKVIDLLPRMKDAIALGKNIVLEKGSFRNFLRGGCTKPKKNGEQLDFGPPALLQTLLFLLKLIQQI